VTKHRGFILNKTHDHCKSRTGFQKSKKESRESLIAEKLAKILNVLSRANTNSDWMALRWYAAKPHIQEPTRRLTAFLIQFGEAVHDNKPPPQITEQGPPTEQ